jgi:hypothetical protein
MTLLLSRTSRSRFFLTNVMCYFEGVLLVHTNGHFSVMNRRCRIGCRWGNIEFPLPFGRVMSATESFIHGLDEKVN